MTISKSLFSSGKDDWRTPPDFFKRYDDVYHFVLDAAADSTNHLCRDWLGLGSPHGEDALKIDWLPWLRKGNIWCNPPYSRGLQAKFIEEAYLTHLDNTAQVYSIVMLLPARTDTKVFHNYIWDTPRVHVRFIRGRLKFVGAKAGAPFPSMIVTFGYDRF